MAGTSGGGLRPRRGGRGGDDGAGLFAGATRRRSDRSGVDEPAPWRSRRSVRVVTALTVLAGVLFLLWLAWVGYLFFARGGPSGLAFDPDRRCTTLSFSCGILTNLLASVVLVALASAFLLWRLFGLQRRYRARARNESRELVPTAGAIIDQVVGRDELCKVLMADLHDRRTRPHVLVGGVGTGKTAVLVRLTEFLAEKRAVPVPVRLRDATTELDFENLARDRFLSEVNQSARLGRGRDHLAAAAQGREDRRARRRPGGGARRDQREPERDNIIRAAIRKAHQQHLPLVIASRPHDPLRATEAAILILEPLSYEAALAYIGSDGTREDERGWPGSSRPPTWSRRRCTCRSPASCTSRDCWSPPRRASTASSTPAAPTGPAAAGAAADLGTGAHPRAPVRGRPAEPGRAARGGRAHVGARLRRAQARPARRGVRRPCRRRGSPPKCSAGSRRSTSRRAGPRAWAASTCGWPPPGPRSWSSSSCAGNSVRFPHSLMQAYLGSRLLDAALQDPGYRREALRHPQPGREFLIALVLRSRAAGRPASPRPDRRAAAGPAPALRLARRASVAPAAPPHEPAGLVGALPRGRHRPRRQQGPGHVRGRARDRLRRGRARAHDHRRADQEAVVPDPRARSAGRWRRASSRLVRRFGEAARTIDDRRRQRRALRRRAGLSAAVRDRLPRALLSGPARGGAGDRGRRRRRLRRRLRTCSPRRARPAPAERAARGAARPAPAAILAPGRSDDGASWRALAVMSAWLAPMLAGSVGAAGRQAAHQVLAGQAQADLAQWLRHHRPRRPPAGRRRAAASRWRSRSRRASSTRPTAGPRPADDRAKPRMYLAEQALEMLKGSRYWFSQLTLSRRCAC